MTLEEECALSYYQPISMLDEERGVCLVQHTENHRVFVKKELSVYDADVYRYLRAHRVKNTPAVCEVVEDGGKLIVIEEYLNGTPLQEILEREGPLEERRVEEIARQLCLILEQLHEAEPPIIHRDVKPSNILITPEGEVRLIDMNAAKHYREGTQDAQLIGTVGYAAPEQYGFGVSNVRTDIYSLGVLMNVLLTGSLPREGVAEGPLRPVIERCTKLEPAERYGSVREVLEALPAENVREPSAAVSRRRYLPPGFRSLQPRVMLLSSVGYVLLFVLIFNLPISHRDLTELWLRRAFFAVIALFIIFFTADCLNVWEKIGLTRIRSGPLRAFLVLLIDCAAACILVLLMTVIEKTALGR